MNIIKLIRILNNFDKKSKCNEENFYGYKNPLNFLFISEQNEEYFKENYCEYHNESPIINNMRFFIQNEDILIDKKILTKKNNCYLINRQECKWNISYDNKNMVEYIEKQ